MLVWQACRPDSCRTGLLAAWAGLFRPGPYRLIGFRPAGLTAGADQRTCCRAALADSGARAALWCTCCLMGVLTHCRTALLAAILADCRYGSASSARLPYWLIAAFSPHSRPAEPTPSPAPACPGLQRRRLASAEAACLRVLRGRAGLVTAREAGREGGVTRRRRGRGRRRRG